MIRSYRDYMYYLERDRIANGIPEKVKFPRFGQDEIWRWLRLLRRTEYFVNCKQGKVWGLYNKFLKLKFHKYSLKMGFSIPLNVFEEGLYIPHYGTIVVNGKAKVGKNCRIQENVTIGDSRGGYLKLATMFIFVQEQKLLEI